MANDFPSKGEITLWAFPASCSMVPHILLKETGVDFQFTPLAIKGGFPEEFRKINPKMQVPVLGVGQEIITELPAIATSISQLAPDKHLLGSSPLETIRVYEWLSWLAVAMHASAFTVLARPYRFSDDETAHESISAKGMEKFQNCIRYIEERLTGPSAVPGGFTAVDAFMFVMYRWAVEKKAVDMAKFPKYTALFKAVRDRPMVQAVLEVEGVHLQCDKW